MGLKTIARLWGKGAQCYAIRAESSGEQKNVHIGKLNPEIDRLITNFSVIFDEPQGLPPTRTFDHGIPLKVETQPINVHPYRYAHFQKEEIERQVKKMLKNGLSRPSTSPFSSPVLLVKKKDGSWRFCTDY